MPKPTAIKLSRKTVDVISITLRIPYKDVEAELKDYTSYYYVKDCSYMGQPVKYMIYSKHGFLDEFASVPPGIEDRFVPVTQVKEP
jgi:hypothetical protein